MERRWHGKTWSHFVWVLTRWKGSSIAKAGCVEAGNVLLRKEPEERGGRVGEEREHPAEMGGYRTKGNRAARAQLGTVTFADF